jgi:hypothetical protein
VTAQRKPVVRFGRTDTPPVDTVVGVWYPPEQRIVEAVWDGTIWRGRTGEPIAGEIMYWYPQQ